MSAEERRFRCVLLSREPYLVYPYSTVHNVVIPVPKMSMQMTPLVQPYIAKYERYQPFCTP